MKDLHSAGLAASRRDSFAHSVETVGGMMTSLSSGTPSSPPEGSSLGYLCGRGAEQVIDEQGLSSRTELDRIMQKA